MECKMGGFGSVQRGRTAGGRGGNSALMAVHCGEAPCITLQLCPDRTLMIDHLTPRFNLKSMASIDTCQSGATCAGSSQAETLSPTAKEATNTEPELQRADRSRTKGGERERAPPSLIQLFYFWQLGHKVEGVHR